MCCQHISIRTLSDALTSSGQNDLSLHPRGTTSPISSSVTPPSSRKPRTPSQILVTSSEPGRFLRAFSPRLPESSARTAGSVATKLPTDADVLLASADDIPNPPAPVDKLTCARWWGSSVRRSAMHPSSKNDDSSAVPGSSRRFSSIYIAPLSARLHAGRHSSGSITRSTYAVRCTIEPVAMRLAACLSGIRGNICASCSTPPSRTIPMAFSIALVPSGQGNRVEVYAPRYQLSLEEGYYFHRPG